MKDLIEKKFFFPGLFINCVLSDAEITQATKMAAAASAAAALKMDAAPPATRLTVSGWRLHWMEVGWRRGSPAETDNGWGAMALKGFGGLVLYLPSLSEATTHQLSVHQNSIQKRAKAKYGHKKWW